MSLLERLRLVPVRAQEREDGMALIMSMALIGIFSTLMLSMLALVVNQVKPTAQARKDIGSVNAAGSGLQAGLANLRDAVDVNGEGSRGLLPCKPGSADTATFTAAAASAKAPGASLPGSASTLAGTFTYRVDISYFTADPTDRDPAWLSANAMRCPLKTTPLYAFLQSYGTGANLAGAGGPRGTRGNRSQTAVYQFSVPQANVAGGRLVSFGTDLCLDAGSSPTLGTKLYFTTCQPKGTPSQQWQYRADLTLFYGGNPALNLCIQGAAGSEEPNLRRCTGSGDDSTYDTGLPHYRPGQQVQEFSFNDSGHFATAADNGDVTGTCLQPASTAVGAQAVLTGCSGGTTDWQAFDPDPEVGAGKAGGNTSGIPGSPTNQYVNFEEFGRCLDVTAQNVNASFLIAYPCKQAPDSTLLRWNQVWSWNSAGSGTGTVSTASPSGQYCLTAPGSGSFVTIRPCQNGLTTQQWKATGNVPDSPSTSYNLVSLSRVGQCMGLEDSRGSSFGSRAITVENCSGANDQRWNAPPPLPPAGLNNIEEGGLPR